MTRHCPLHLGFPMCLGVLVAICSVDKAKGRICETTLGRQGSFDSMGGPWTDQQNARVAHASNSATLVVDTKGFGTCLDPQQGRVTE